MLQEKLTLHESRSGRATVGAFASNQIVPGLIPSGVTDRFSMWELCVDDSVGPRPIEDKVDFQCYALPISEWARLHLSNSHLHYSVLLYAQLFNDGTRHRDTFHPGFRHTCGYLLLHACKHEVKCRPFTTRHDVMTAFLAALLGSQPTTEHITNYKKAPVFPNTFIHFPRKNVGLEDANRTTAYPAEGTRSSEWRVVACEFDIDSSLVAPKYAYGLLGTGITSLKLPCASCHSLSSAPVDHVTLTVDIVWGRLVLGTSAEYESRYILNFNWLDYSPPTYVRSLPDFCLWESCRMMAQVSEFSRRSPVSPLPIHSGAAPHAPRLTLTGSQDLDVKSRQPWPRVRAAARAAGREEQLDGLAGSTEVQATSRQPVRARGGAEELFVTSRSCARDASSLSLSLLGAGAAGRHDRRRRALASGFAAPRPPTYRRCSRCVVQHLPPRHGLLNDLPLPPSLSATGAPASPLPLCERGVQISAAERTTLHFYVPHSYTSNHVGANYLGRKLADDGFDINLDIHKYRHNTHYLQNICIGLTHNDCP
ncbi:hypothetical protein PR048_023548 [Dryococelus australis]|uniref:Uncharacterized protein n=1 Tax=Dryococelus australis TaxID=614101 RepID=A0ABQ9GUD5_9NEOP|nr:hypothetical protein PR048_023548 [Dryococelus australis]